MCLHFMTLHEELFFVCCAVFYKDVPVVSPSQRLWMLEWTETTLHLFIFVPLFLLIYDNKRKALFSYMLRVVFEFLFLANFTVKFAHAYVSGIADSI